MELPCIYALKTRDMGWVNGFYPVRRLREEFAKLGVEFRAYLVEGAGEVFARLAAQAAVGDVPPACMLRGELPAAVLDAAAATGALCINAPAALKKAQDKLATYSLLREAGLAAPRTVAAPAFQCGLEDYSRYMKDYCGKAGIAFPAVVKPRFGSRGRGVRLARSPAEAAALLRGKAGAKSSYIMEETLIQEYVPSSRGRDVRVLVAGGRAIAIAERARDLSCAEDWEIASNAAAGGAFFHLSKEMDEMRPSLESAACLACGRLGLFYAACDFLPRPNGDAAICEVNGSPGFEALERGLGLNVAGALARSIFNYSLKAALAR